jgi:hypothetical protein
MRQVAKTQGLWLFLIILAYVVLGLTYALATPPLEASDEFEHYPVVQYVQTRHTLPVLDPDDPSLWLQEAAQPPLYYLIMGALTAWIDTSDLPDLHHLNPHAFIGNPGQVTNKNLIIHQPERESFPWRGAVLAVYVVRLASIGLGVGTLLLTARLGSLLFSPQVGLLAAALTAFNPMFLFVSAAVNNDSLAILLGHLGLYLLVRLWQETPDPRHWWYYVRLGLVLGLGMLTKLSLLGLLGLTGLALAWLAWRRQAWRLLFVGGVIVLLAALVVSGWWFARNLRLYGDLTGLDVFVTVLGMRDTPLTWQGWVGEFGTFYRSFWGLFGGVNVAAPEFFYIACNVAALAGMVGLIVWFRRKTPRARGGVVLLAAWAAIVFILLIRWTLTSISFQGRLTFPALGALNVLWAVGLLAWVSDTWRPHLAVALAGLILVAAAALPWVTIRPAYAYPTPLMAVPDEAQFGPIAFEADNSEIRLVGVEMLPGQSVTPASKPVKAALYWQAVHAVERDYVSTIHLLGRGYASVGQVNRYPAWGMIPTSRWKAGQIWRDVYHVYVNADADAPTRLRVNVGLYDAQAGRTLAASGPDGVPMQMVIVGEARLGSDQAASLQPPTLLEVALADGITFTGYGLDPQPAAPGDEVRVTLYWQATATPSQDYTVFVHLLGLDGSQVAVADAPPVGNDYPTSLWREGDQVEDPHLMLLPAELLPGVYRIAIGLYDPVSGIRLARLDGAGDSIAWPLTVTAQ